MKHHFEETQGRNGGLINETYEVYAMIPMLNHRPNKTERQVIAAIRRVDHRYLILGRKSAKWTRAVKNEVGTLGEKVGYKVYGAQCKFDRNGEWMFDLCWGHEKGDIGLGLPLVMESEWDSKDILWDFSKLVMARADLRVMVFWEKTKQRADKVLEKMLHQIHKFKGTTIGDRYLLCYWTDKPDKLFVESYVVRKP